MEMEQMVKDFFKNGKKYLDYIMGLDFTELMINILEIIGLVILALLVYLPIGLVQDLLYEVIRSAFGASEVVFKWYTVLFRFFTGVVAFVVFMYLFNRRYSKLNELIEKDVMRNRKEKEKKEHKENSESKEDNKEEIDLPKKKD
jgi:uncharacterized protein YacL